MKEQPSTVSPFAALDTRQQMEQWIWWQCQHDRDKTAEDAALDAQLPEAKEQATDEPAKAAITMPPVHHGQYDAVIRRMHAAGKRTTAYIPCTESL